MTMIVWVERTLKPLTKKNPKILRSLNKRVIIFKSVLIQEIFVYTNPPIFSIHTTSKYLHTFSMFFDLFFVRFENALKRRNFNLMSLLTFHWTHHLKFTVLLPKYKKIQIHFHWNDLLAFKNWIKQKTKAMFNQLISINCYWKCDRLSQKICRVFFSTTVRHPFEILLS